MREEAGVGATVLNAAHALAVAELFRGHAEYADKAGCGVRRYFVDFAPDHPNSVCFWIERENGERTDFGIAACLKTVAALNRQSFRALIRPQIYVFKDAKLLGSNGFFHSDYSGELYPIADAHVDHEIEFDQILAVEPRPN